MQHHTSILIHWRLFLWAFLLGILVGRFVPFTSNIEAWRFAACALIITVGPVLLRLTFAY